MSDPVDLSLLQAFVALTDTRSFTAAAKRLGLRQSTVSQRIARLESQIGRRLFVRTTHSVTPTLQGDAFLSFARDVLDASERLGGFVQGRPVKGLVRAGISEDFALSGLADMLRSFRQRHLDVEIELTIGLSGELYSRFDAGALDLVFAKRQAGDKRGELLWREDLVWIGREGFDLDPAEPIPLILYPPPSITRKLALKGIEQAGLSWRIVCTATSLSGLRAAALAGLGVLPHSQRLIPAGLVVLPSSPALPPVGTIEFVVLSKGNASSPAGLLAAALRDGSARFARSGASSNS